MLGCLVPGISVANYFPLTAHLQLFYSLIFFLHYFFISWFTFIHFNLCFYLKRLTDERWYNQAVEGYGPNAISLTVRCKFYFFFNRECYFNLCIHYVYFIISYCIIWVGFWISRLMIIFISFYVWWFISICVCVI